MKRTLLFTAALGAAVGAFSLGAAQAQGPGGNGNGGGGQSGGQVMLPQKNATQTKSQNRETYEYRNEYRNSYRTGESEGEYGMPSNYREEVRNMNQAREQWKKMDEVASDLRAEGYQISKMEMERYSYEAKVRDRDGRRLELKLDPVSGEIIGSELD